MSPAQDVTWFGSFYQHDPSSQRFTCIYFTKAGNSCKCLASDTQRASELRREILDSSSKLTNTDQLEEYIRCLCDNYDCARHCDRIKDDGILIQLAERWKGEILQRRGVRSISVLTTSSPPPSLPEFRPRMTRPGPTDSVSYKIREKLIDRDVEPGSLYIFSRPSSPGYVKIGWTAVSVDGRLNAWAKCGYTPNELFRVGGVPHAQRVETLTHYELINEWRKQRPCVQCGGVEHQEWFETSRKRAEQVVGDWARFMKEAKPYVLDGFLKPEWQLYMKDHKSVTAQDALAHHIVLVAGKATPQAIADDTERIATIKEEEQAGSKSYEVEESSSTMADKFEMEKEEIKKEEEEEEDDRLVIVEEKPEPETKNSVETDQGKGQRHDSHPKENKQDTSIVFRVRGADEEKKEGGHLSPKKETEQPLVGHRKPILRERITICTGKGRRSVLSPIPTR
ncbi:hypothetical protein PG984_012463 [Apiospora sp. TS-2023a]